MNNAILACHSLAKTYMDGTAKIEVFKNINFCLAPGEMVAILGASGSGKSTLLHLLGGLDKPTSGTVSIREQALTHLSEVNKCELRNRYLGFIYQFHHLLPEFSALENVAMPLLIRGTLSVNVITEKASELLHQVGLAERMQHRLAQLSGGERQRVAIARALVTDPLCVLADEPTGNLDPRNAERVLTMFYDLQAKINTSVVMVTHDIAIANASERKLKIEAGQLVEL